MKLGTKLLLTIGSIFLCLIIVLLFLSQSLLLGSFKLLEQENATRNVERAISALNEEIDSLSSLNLDWASWDDSYFFIKDRNREFIKSNLNIETLAKQKLNLIIFLNDAGSVVYDKALEHDEIKEVPLPKDILPIVCSENILNKNQEGIIVFNGRFLMLSARPIMTSEGKGPVRGTLIMGRYLDDKEVKGLADTTHMHLSVIPYQDFVFKGLKKGADAEFSNHILIRTVSEDIVAGFGLVNDLYSKPAFIFRVELPRGIYKQGKVSLFYFIMYLLIAALTSALAILLLLKQNVLSRFSNLSRHMREIGKTGNLSERVAALGRDEVTDLAVEINKMLSSLETVDKERAIAQENLVKANDELEIRVRERTTELLNKNVELNEEITERKKIESAMQEMIYHDYLTGLPNRLLFTDRLNQIIARGSRHKDIIAAVLFIDVDRFKVVNDSLGHSAGDELIKTIALLIRQSLRETDTVARIGGDEFSLLLQDIARTEDIPIVAEKVMDIFRKPISLMGQDVFITVSIGVSVYPYDGTDSVSLLKNSDIAMYHAKSKGGDTYEMYNPTMAKKAVEMHTIGNKLRTALEKEEFLLYYQPQFDLRTGRITGAEALIRWQDKELGLLYPASFIPIAEETGIIIQIGEWGLLTACTLTRKLHEDGFNDLVMSVNVSARMFADTSFTEKIERVLGEIALKPEYLTLELTESILMANLVDAARVVKDLKRYGVKFSIDDFGTGYSSLAYLKNLSITELKIDKSFITDLTTDMDDKLIVKAIINLAHSMNLEVVAEGVEMQEQLDFLVKNGCDKIQGYLFSKPLPENEFIAILNKYNKQSPS